MKYYNLADDNAKKAWESFVTIEMEWKKDPTDKNKFLASRKAFEDYNKERIKLYNFSHKEN